MESKDYEKVNIKEECVKNLLHCPFCGTKDNLQIQHLKGTVLNPSYRVYCDSCGASTGFSSIGNHKEEWNTRF
tara:strand:- start:545 stop:763 length:219 start_codon:yes stop_codon:yes gene_type:complete